MKKFLVTALAFVLSIITLSFVACTPAEPTDPTYNGNYTDVTAQELYTASQNVNTSWGLPAPATTLKTQTYGTFTHTVTTNDYENRDYYFFSELSSVYNDNGTFKQEAVIRIEETSKTKSADYNGSTATTTIFYIKDSKYYMHVKASYEFDGEKSNYEFKMQVDYDEFNDKYGDVIEYVKPKKENVPSGESNFINFISSLVSNGIKITADLTQEGLKVQATLENKDLAADFFSSRYDLEGFSVNPSKFSACYAFNADNTLKAYKHDANIRFVSPYGNFSYDNSFETKGYDGAITFPNDLDTYIPII